MFEKENFKSPMTLAGNKGSIQSRLCSVVTHFLAIYNKPGCILVHQKSVCDRAKKLDHRHCKRY